MRQTQFGVIRWLVSGIAVLASIPGAHAGMLSSDPAQDSSPTVLLSKSVLVEGDDPSVMMIKVPAAGEIFATATDLAFPQPLEQLQFALSGTTGPLVSLSNPGTITLDVTKPMTLYAEVFAVAQDGPDLGLYNLTVTWMAGPMPVPLPASGWLLGAALAVGLGLVAMFRSTQATVTGGVA